MTDRSHLYAIAIGSNRRHVAHGRPSGVVIAAITRLDADFALFDASPILINPAISGAGREFANAVALIESPLNPLAMLTAIKAIERDFGRRGARRWAARVLDLDLIAWSGGRFRSRSLTIPHPAASARAFVMAPLAAIAPNWRLDGAHTARQLAARLGKARPTR